MEIITRVTLNRIDREDLKPGDHIYSWRTAYVYAHHGIYVGEGMVIHFTTRDRDGPGNISSSTVSRSANNPCPICGIRSNRDGVIYTCLDNCFLKGGNLYRFEYGVSLVYFSSIPQDTLRPICSLAASDPPEDVLRRARDLLQNGFGAYDLVLNNCIHFAKYCKTGNRYILA